MPLILAGERRRQDAATCTPLAAGETTFSYGLSEREAGSDTAAMKCRAVRDGDDWVLNGQKSWITNAGVSEFYTVLAVTDPDGPRGSNVTAFVVEKSDAGLHLRREGAQARHQGQPHPRAALRRRAASPATGSSARSATGSRSRCAPSTTPASPSARRPSASRRARSTTPSPTSRSASSSARRIADFQGVQFMLADMAMAARGRPPAGLRRRRQVRARRRRPAVLRRGGQVLRLRRRDEGHHRRRAAARRRRLHPATSRSSG